MKVLCEININSDDIGGKADYNIKFKNLSKPDEPIDYTKMMSLIAKIFKDVDTQVESTGIESTEDVVKEIH